MNTPLLTFTEYSIDCVVDNTKIQRSKSEVKYKFNILTLDKDMIPVPTATAGQRGQLQDGAAAGERHNDDPIVAPPGATLHALPCIELCSG